MPLLVGTLIAAAILGPAAYFWRSYQVSCTAGAFLERADRLEEENDFQAAAGHLYRYLRLHPDDADVRIRLAETFDKSAKDGQGKWRAKDLYYWALGVVASSKQAEKERALRRRLAELLLELGEHPELAELFASAEAEANKILKPNEAEAKKLLKLNDAEAKKLLELIDNDPHGRRLLALALYGQFRKGTLAAKHQSDSTVGEAFERALGVNPGNVELSGTLAWIYRDEDELLSEANQALTPDDRAKLADRVMDQMVTANPKNADALLARYGYRTQYGLPGAEEDLQGALKYGPDSTTVLLTAAEHARREAGRVQQARGPSDEIRRNYQKARDCYERAIKVAPSDQRAYLGLGNVYRAQGEIDRAVKTWQEGIDNGNGESIRLNLLLAEVLTAQGKLDEAGKALDALDRELKRLGQNRWVLQSVKNSGERSYKFLRGTWHMAQGKYGQAIPLLTEVSLGQHSTAPEVDQSVRAGWLLGQAHAALAQTSAASNQRDKALSEWKEAAIAFGRAARLRPTNWQLRKAAGDAWKNAEEPENAQPHYARARELLRKIEGENPGSAGIFQWLVFVYEQLGYSADADRALEKSEALAHKSASPHLLRAGLYSVRRRYDEAREVLRGGLQTLPSKVHAALEYALVWVSLREGDTQRVQRELENLHEKYPSIEVDQLRSQIQGRRSPWLAAHLFNGDVLARQGRFKEAVEAYQEAIRLGDQRLPVYERLVRLLYGLQRFAEVDQYLTRLQNVVPSSENLSSLEMRVAVRQGQLGRAVEVARRGVERRPEDPVARIWLGQILLANKQTEEAGAAFRKAVELAPAEVAGYHSLFRYYYGTQQTDRARKVLQQLVTNVKVCKPQQSVLAQGYELLGGREKAEAAYREAVSLAPDAAAVQVELAKFLLRGNGIDNAEAEDLLRKVAPESGGARRTLAAILAARGGEEHWREAQQLLEASGGDGDVSSLDRRLQAVLLYRRGGRDNIKKARQILEGLVADSGGAAAGDRLALARLYEAEGNLEKARQEYLSLVGRADPDPLHLASHVGFLLRHNFKDEAATWLAKLEEAAPDKLDTLRLRTRWLYLYSEERRVRIEQLVEPFAEKLLKNCEGDEQETQLSLSIGNVYLAAEQYGAAERWHRRLVTRADPSTPHLTLYIDLVLRPDDHDWPPECLEKAAECLEKLEQKAPDNLGTLGLKARWLRRRDRTSEIQSLVEGFASRLLENLQNDESRDDQSQEAQLALSIGDIYSTVEQHQAAERWYRRLKELIPERYGRLAMSLAWQGRTGDAIRLCIEAAKSDSSARPVIVLASILAAGKPTGEDFRLAEPLLSKAVENYEDNAELFFHIANVRTLQEENEDAAQLYRQVLELRPKHVVALNNLATVLSEQPDKRSEALQYIDQAIQITGPQAGLLDTKGMIFVHEGRADKGAELLEEAASAPNPDPRFLFHLAVAYDRVGKVDEARKALNSAHDGNLTDQILTRSDRKLLAELEQKYLQ